MDYWKECISIAFEENEIVATDAQIENVARCVESSHENYGMAYGYDCIPNPVQTQAQEELRKLKRENQIREVWINSTKACRTCTTTGTVKDRWGRDQTCFECDGKGRVKS